MSVTLDAVALGATLNAPIKSAIDFESAMADVRKVVTSDTPDGLQKLDETLQSCRGKSHYLPQTLPKLQQAVGNWYRC